MGDAFVQAVAGGCAAGLASLVFHPLDLVKIRLNKGSDEDGLPYKSAVDVIVRQYRKSGIAGFYAGLQVKILQDVIRCVAFFYVFSSLKREFRKRFGKISMAANLVLGYLAATFNLVITMPVEVANTRMITGVSKDSLLTTWAEIIRHRGVQGLYTGLSSNLVLCLNPAIKHMVFDKARSGLLKGRRALSSAEAFWLGVAATVAATTATFPFIRSRAILQSFRAKQARAECGNGNHSPAPEEGGNKFGITSKCDGGGSSSSGASEGDVDPSASQLRIIKDIVNKHGISGLYKGLFAQLMKGTLSSGFLLATKERVFHGTEVVIQSVTKRIQ